MNLIFCLFMKLTLNSKVVSKKPQIYVIFFFLLFPGLYHFFGLAISPKNANIKQDAL